MTINEIINGKPGGFPGLIPLVHLYLDSSSVLPDERTQLNRHLRLISRRASGELMTAAAYIRSFVRSHPAYQHDSVISPRVNYDLLVHLHRIMRGELHPPTLLGDLRA